MLEHLPGLFAGLVVAAIALLFKRRKTVAPKVIEVVKTAVNKAKAEKIADAEEEHAQAFKKADTQAVRISQADLDALAEMANHEFGSD